MGRLDDITLEELQELREQTEGEIPRERVLAAIGRKQGDELETLAERHGVVEKTIRNWLDRFAREPIEQAPYDDDRPGRLSKLDEEEGEEHLGVWYFPPKLPELNAVEGCWDRLSEWFKHRLIPDLSSLKEQTQRGLRTVDEPNIWNYLCP